MMQAPWPASEVPIVFFLMSLEGASLKRRLYSRENCEQLS